MKIILLGNKGILGRDVQWRLQDASHNIKGLDLDELDITQQDTILPLLEPFSPALIINCAAYTAVDKSESEPELAFLVNRDGAANLGAACAKLGVPLVHISTVYIFDGNSERPYDEEDPPNPLGVYGKSKWEGEKAVRSQLKQHLILRTAWLYGVHGNNFVKTILRLATEKDELRIVADQQGCPTWAGELADTLVSLVARIEKDRSDTLWGTYHFCGRGIATWYDFAQAIIQEAAKWESLSSLRITPITTADYPTPAKRPKWSVLDCTKIERVFGIRPKQWRQGLSLMLEELYSAKHSQVK